MTEPNAAHADVDAAAAKARAHDSHAAHTHAHGHAAGHGGHLHDAPPSMAFALIVLAIGSVLAGFVGIPHALGGSNRIETFLDESFVPPGRAHAAEAPAAGEVPLAPEHPSTPAEGEAHAGDTRTEFMLMGLSTGIALAGIGLAWYFWRRNLAAADAWSKRFSPLYNLLCNKYYVDEIYDAVIVQPIKIISTGALWKGIDAGGIDVAVNGVGLGVSGGSSLLRRLQTGSIRAYAASLFLGVVLILGYYLWR